MVGLVAACAPWVQAQMLDWNSVDWSRGVENQTFSNVQNTGIDITISLSLSYDSQSYRSGDNSYTTKTDWLSTAPDDLTTFGGDGSTRDGESLYLGVNFASDNRTQSYLDVTILFSQSVHSVSFDLFDVDAYGYNYRGGYERGVQFVDVIEQIQSEYQGGIGGDATVGFNNSKMNLTDFGSGDAYVGDTILNDGGTDQNDNPASVLNLSWSNPVDSVSFRYTTGPGAVADPGQQAIGLSSIAFHQYNAVPEPGTYLLGFLGLGAILLSVHRKYKKSKSRLPVLEA
jgi:hypothetical protein